MHCITRRQWRVSPLTTFEYLFPSSYPCGYLHIILSFVLTQLTTVHPGFFTHIHSPSSTGHPYTLVIIFCEVKHAIDPNSRVMVYVLYAPGHVPPRESGASLQDPHGFTCELLSSGWKIIGNDATPVKDDLQEWKVQVEGVGTMEIGRHTQLWTVHIPAHQSAGHGDLELVVETTKRTPWTTESIIAGPEGSQLLAWDSFCS
jgi:hypothetical protein